MTLPRPHPHSHRHSPAAPRHWAWLLWLAMLLPLAQLAGAAHEVSHIERVRTADSQKALHIGHCDLCVVAAAIGSGGAAMSQASLVLPGDPATPVALLAQAALRAASRQPYASRAPPAFLH